MRRAAVVLSVPALVLSVVLGGSPAQAAAAAPGSGAVTTILHPPKCC